jgi:DNA-binding Xre family transcriptional regulator
MPMKWKVKETAEFRGYTNARALAAAAKVPPMSMYQIWNSEAKRVDLATLEKLCILLKAPLYALLEYVPDEVEPLPGEASKKRARKPQNN